MAKRSLVMFAATVVVAAIVAGGIIVALGDTSDVAAPAATPTLAAVIAPTATPLPPSRVLLRRARRRYPSPRLEWSRRPPARRDPL